MRLLEEYEIKNKFERFNRLRGSGFIARFPEDIDTRIKTFLEKTKDKLYSCLAGEIREGDWYVKIEGSALGQWSPDSELCFAVKPDDVEWIKKEMENLKPAGDYYYHYCVRAEQLKW